MILLNVCLLCHIFLLYCIICSLRAFVKKRPLLFEFEITYFPFKSKLMYIDLKPLIKKSRFQDWSVYSNGCIFFNK